MAISLPKNHILHPGKILEEIFMKDIGFNQSSLASEIGCKPGKINEIINGKRSITPKFAIELSKPLKISAETLARLQCDYDLFVARKEENSEDNIISSQNFMKDLIIKV